MGTVEKPHAICCVRRHRCPAAGSDLGPRVVGKVGDPAPRPRKDAGSHTAVAGDLKLFPNQCLIPDQLDGGRLIDRHPDYRTIGILDLILPDIDPFDAVFRILLSVVR